MEIPKRSALGYLGVFLRGVVMGAADVVPGVSGGTIAFISGIYDELLYSLSKINPKLLMVLKDEGIAAVWMRVNGNFLSVLFTGVLVSILSFARLISWALESYPTVVWAFFLGLIAASIIYMARQQRAWGAKQVVACALGALIVLGISFTAPAQLPGEPWILFLGGAIAICAMILPGVSGSFLLLLMGLYPVVIAGVSELNLSVIGSVALGCIVGLLAFSKLLNWLLEHHHSTTFATLIGFLIGSVNVIWPWKNTVETRLDRHGEIVPLIRENVLPQNYEVLTGLDPQIFTALAFSVVGFLLVLLAEIFLSGSRLSSVDKT